MLIALALSSILPAQTNAEIAEQTFGLKALDIDEVAPEEGLFDRSDNVSFAKVGIPAPT